MPSLTCSSVKVCLSVYLCTRFIPDMMILSIRRQMCNKQTPALGTCNKKQKLQKLWRNSSDPLSFVGYYDRGRRESKRAHEREREKRHKRERRAKNICTVRRPPRQPTVGLYHLGLVHTCARSISCQLGITMSLTDWLTCWINIYKCLFAQCYNSYNQDQYCKDN
jgi:hypothetical protein